MLKRRRCIEDILDKKIGIIEYYEVAANKIRKNWRSKQFNWQMSPFILMCAIYHKTWTEIVTWNSTIIQKRFRGFNFRYLMLYSIQLFIQLSI